MQAQIDYTKMRLGAKVDAQYKIERCPMCGKKGYRSGGQLVTVTHRAKIDNVGGIPMRRVAVGDYCIIPLAQKVGK